MIYDGDLNRNIWAEFDIDYDYDPPEYNFRHRFSIPGNITIHSVKVLRIEGYNRNGQLSYEKARVDIAPEYLEVLDASAFEYVQSSIDNWDQLAEYLVSNAT